MKFPHALLWCDLETTGLDPATLHVLEAAFLLTDFDLNPIAGYTEVVKLTREALQHLMSPGNEVPLQMHKDNGLLRDARDSQFTLAQIETATINMLRQETAFEPGEFLLAGSGVAAFDLQVLRRTMPTLASWITYYQFDTGNLRRTIKILAGGKDLVNPYTPSFADGVKRHRAWPDVEAHLEEGRRYQEFFRSIAASV